MIRLNFKLPPRPLLLANAWHVSGALLKEHRRRSKLCRLQMASARSGLKRPLDVQVCAPSCQFILA